MPVVDAILNLACLLLWLNWCSARLGSWPAAPPLSLAGTLRRAESRPAQNRWLLLMALAALLAGRGWFYHQVGPGLDWSASISLPGVTLFFRSDRLDRIELYSFLSFGGWWFVFYAWLLLLSVVNRAAPEANPILRAIHRHLGRVGRLPPPARLALPAVAAGLLWLLLHPLLAHLGIVPDTVTGRTLGLQALVIGASGWLAWKSLLIGLLLIHLVNSHVYLGDGPFWQFVAITGNRLLAPLRRLPLRFGRLDLAPVAGLIVVTLATRVLEKTLTKLFQNL